MKRNFHNSKLFVQNILYINHVINYFKNLALFKKNFKTLQILRGPLQVIALAITRNKFLISLVIFSSEKLLITKNVSSVLYV